jgi:hypothetical protein
LHSSQASLVALAVAMNLPVVQLAQVGWLVKGFVVPGSQGKQKGLPCLSWYHPVGQALQVVR